MEFCAVLRPIEPVVPGIAKLASLAEQSGFKYIGVEDIPLLLDQNRRELYTALTIVAANTKYAKVGPWVTNPYTCHPTSTAFKMATIDELSGGRAMLGFAVGGPFAKALAPSTNYYEISEEAINMMRTIFRGEILEIKGWKYRLNMPTPDIPIFWAAQAERSLRFGGRIADGVILSNWIDENSIKFALKDIEKGAIESGRTLDQVPVFFMLATSISSDREKAIKDVTPYVTMVLNTTAAERLPGWGDDEEEAKKFSASFSWLKMHSRQEADMMVPREVIAKKALAGTPEDCVKAIKFLERVGIKRVAMLLECSDTEETLREFKQSVLPEFV